jgi:hypothetical protein
VGLAVALQIVDRRDGLFVIPLGESREDPRLSVETFDGSPVSRQIRFQNLDRDAAI